MITARTRGAAAVLGAAVALGMTACSSGKSSDDADPAVDKVSGKITMTYLQKQGDQQYFLDEAAGAKAKAKELGVKLKVVNLGNDANKTISEVQSAVAQKSNGLIIVVPDPAVGPQVVQTAKDGKVALLASDDEICVSGTEPAKCAKEDLVPRIGFSGQQMGKEVGAEAARLFKKSGWKADDTRILAAWKQDVNVCGERVKAAGEAFDEATGGDVKTLKVATDNTPTGAQDKVAGTITGNPKVKHWIVWGCNDENVQGGVTALENAHVKADNIIGVGLGGYLACKGWEGGKPSGMKSALFINGRDVGALSVQKMYDKLKDGKDFPQEAFAKTEIVDPSNWKTSGLKCS